MAAPSWYDCLRQQRPRVAERTAPGSDEEDLVEIETLVTVAWPAPDDPPPRAVRLAGMQIDAWPQADGSVLYEIKYRRRPYVPKQKRKRHRDTLSMELPKAVDEEEQRGPASGDVAPQIGGTKK